LQLNLGTDEMLPQTNHCRQANATSDARGGSRARQFFFVWTLVAIWSGAVATGMCLLVAYANTAGNWLPAPATIGRSDDETSTRHRLFMFLHPRCPCSVASVNELARIMSRCSAQLDATVYFVRPASQPADWERGSLWNLVSSIPGVNVETDVGGRVAEQFYASTSGVVFVYDRLGELCFQGGITAARGHAGDNLGQSAVIDIALGGKSNVERSPVFGCPFRAELADSGS
jgi:hypothetical protein